jgi:L-threonylcarbamoyladenylate synthase
VNEQTSAARPEVLAWPTEPALQKDVAQRAAAALQQGSLVVYPTDTVYGLGALATVSGALERIYAVKGRPDEKAIIWLVDSLDRVGTICEVDERAEKLAQAFWPGGLTLILPRAHPSEGALPTLGVRIPAHPAALAIIAAAGGVVPTTSANRSGAPSARTAQDAEAQLGGDVDLIIDAGIAPVGTESTVLDVSGADIKILRPGAIGEAQIRSVLGA